MRRIVNDRLRDRQPIEHGQRLILIRQVGQVRRRRSHVGNLEHETRVIGTRHGEKLYESLISREEMAHAIDMGGYYRIPADNRDLNYAKYFSEGEADISTLDDYTSHNTRRLNVEEVKSLLLSLDYIKDELNA